MNYVQLSRELTYWTATWENKFKAYDTPNKMNLKQFTKETLVHFALKDEFGHF